MVLKVERRWLRALLLSGARRPRRSLETFATAGACVRTRRRRLLKTLRRKTRRLGLSQESSSYSLVESEVMCLFTQSGIYRSQLANASVLHPIPKIVGVIVVAPG